MVIRIATIVGARPQFIKAAVISRAIKKYNAANNAVQFEEYIIHTGQHFDEKLSAVFFEEMDIPRPHVNLDINTLSHGAMTGKMLEKIEGCFNEILPDMVIVYGDTNSTLAGALAAAKMHIPVVHIEAGLRSFNKRMPEEINRVMSDHISSVLFCPTEQAVQNLHEEGISNVTTPSASHECAADFIVDEETGFPIVIFSGDVMQDAALFYSAKEDERAYTITELGFNVDTPFALGTLHRAENTDAPERLREIFSALGQCAESMPVVLPLHPRTANKIQAFDVVVPQGVHLVAPVGYLEMTRLLRECSIVLTDSGGVQKEAFFFKKPCVVLRDQTEWVELLAYGSHVLAGACKDTIYNAFCRYLNFDGWETSDLYGGGTAGDNIVAAILKIVSSGLVIPSTQS